MLRRQFLRYAIAAATIGMAALAGSNRAEAQGIRLTLTSGTTTQQFFTNATFFLGSTTIDGYTIVLNTVLENFPGSTTGNITTTANLATASSGTIDNLTILAEVVTNPATALSTLAPFTAPTPGPWLVKTDVTGTTGADVTSGTVSGTTFVNGTAVTVSGVSLPALTENSVLQTVATPPLTSYTLANRIVISGLNNGIPQGGLGITLTSTVSAVPEPAPIALACAGLPVLGLLWTRRRRARA